MLCVTVEWINLIWQQCDTLCLSLCLFRCTGTTSTYSKSTTMHGNCCVSNPNTYTQKKGHCVDQTLLFFYQYIQFHIDASLSDCPLGLIDGDSSHILIWKTQSRSEIEFFIEPTLYTKYKIGGCTAYTLFDCQMNKLNLVTVWYSLFVPCAF